MKIARWVACGVVTCGAIGAYGVVALAQGNEGGASAPSAAAAGAPPAGATGGDVTVVDFTYDDPERGFTMQVPSDWKVQKNYGGYVLFMEPNVKLRPTVENPVVADPNMSVAALNTPMPIDTRALDDYEKELKAKFTDVNGAGSELNVFSKNVMELPGGKKGLLYYLTYKKNGYDVVSAILVMSSDRATFRVSLTDYKVGFDKNLERYFPVMASIQVKGDAPRRVEPWEAVLPFAAVGGGIVVLLGVAFYVRNRRMKSLLASSPASHRKKNVEDLEGSLLRGDTGSKRKSRPPKDASRMGSAAGSVAGSAAGSGFESAAPDSMIAGSSHGSAAPHSRAVGSSYGSAAPDSMAPGSMAPASVEHSSHDHGSVSPSSTYGKGSAAPASTAGSHFPVSHFETGAKAPHSQPLSVAFAGAEPSDIPQGFDGGTKSDAPRSNKPLPSGKKADKETKRVAESSHAKSSVAGSAPGSSSATTHMSGFPAFEDDDT